MVDIGIRDSLLESMEIEVNGVVHVHTIDYQNISFRFSRCHLHGNLVSNCSLLFYKNIWKRKEPSLVELPIAPSAIASCEIITTLENSEVDAGA